MRELVASIEEWRRRDRKVALATIVKAWGSAPRPLGSKMAISEDGEMVGSVSGGCVEGAVVETALAVLAEGTPRCVDFGVSSEDAFAIGLSCGGTLEILIEQIHFAPLDQASDQASPTEAVPTDDSGDVT